MNNKDKFLMFVDESIRLASNTSTKSAYEKVKHRFIRLFEEYDEHVTWYAYQEFKPDPIHRKYIVQRKDGKIHHEVWNGTGWAYNENDIVYWAEKLNGPHDLRNKCYK